MWVGISLVAMGDFESSESSRGGLFDYIHTYVNMKIQSFVLRKTPPTVLLYPCMKRVL